MFYEYWGRWVSTASLEWQHFHQPKCQLKSSLNWTCSSLWSLINDPGSPHSSSLKNYKWCCFALRSSLDLESPSIFFFPYAGCASEFLRFWLSTTTKMKLIFSRCQELARLMWFCLVFFVSSLGQNWSNVKRPLAVPSRAIYAPISSPISSKEWAWAELLRFLKLFSSRWFSFPEWPVSMASVMHAYFRHFLQPKPWTS